LNGRKRFANSLYLTILQLKDER